MQQAPLTLSSKQWESLGASNCRVNLWEGSIRSGKTFVSLLRFLAFLAVYQGAGTFVMVGRSRDSVFRNIFQPIELDPALAFLRPFVKYRQGSPTATIMGIKVHVLGAHDVKAAAAIQGMTVAGAYCDEITTWSHDFFKMLLGRMSPPGAQLFGTMNPDSPRHWMMVDYLSKLVEFPQWAHWHFTLDDNDTLDEAYKESIKREYTGLWFRRYILGEWVSAEGAIYEAWDESRHIIPWQDAPQIVRVLALGIDYGTTNATSAIMLGLTGGKTPQLIALDEFRYDSRKEQSRLSDARLADRFITWLDSEHHPKQKGLRPEFIFLDPSAASFGEALAERGIHTWAADNDVLEGISDIATLLSLNQIIVTDRCKGLIEEAPAYVWDETASLAGIDRPVKLNDHSLDGWRYAIRSTKGIWQPILRAALDTD